MKTIITQQDLIRYLYKETSKSESRSIETYIQHNSSFRREFEEMKSIISKLKMILATPDNRVVNNILLYSKCTEVLEGSDQRKKIICKN
ncbi:MAG: hypothetical protein V2A54_03355 [Bacteroidota bacterium]